MIEKMILISGISLALITVVGIAVYYAAYYVSSQVFGPTRWCGNANAGSVSLTFDDGPSPDTSDILDILLDANVKATFFLIGKHAVNHPEIAKRIVDEGHEIGNHSYSHPIFLFCSGAKTRLEISATQNILESITGVVPKLVRPPCGVRSRAFFRIADELGLETIQWCDTGFDWKEHSAEKIARNVMSRVQSDSIILLHDGDDAGKASRRATVEALPLIIDGLRKKNLQPVPLKDLCLQTDRELADLRQVND